MRFASVLALKSCVSAIALTVAAGTGTATAAVDRIALDDTVRIAFAQKPLSDALVDISTVANMSIAFQTQQIAAIRAPDLSGVYTVRDLLDRVLANSGLIYQVIDRNTVRVVPARAVNIDAPPAPKALSQLQVAQGRTAVAEEIIVTAQKREERLQDVPASVTAVDTTALAESNQTRLRDYFAGVPGLNISPGAGTGQRNGLMLRGITPLGNNPTVAVLIDDVPFGSATTLSAGHQAVPDLDPGDFARVEVLRGPQGTLYGAAAVGGLLKFVSAEPSLERVSGRVQLGGTTVDHSAQLGYAARAMLNAPVGSNLAVRMSGFTRRDPGYIDNPIFGVKDLNDSHASGGLLSALWVPSEKLSVKLSALYEDIDRDSLPEETLAPGLGRFDQYFPPGSVYVRSTSQSYIGTVKYDPGRVALTSITGYNKFDQKDATAPGAGFGTAIASLYGSSDINFRDSRSTEKITQEVRANMSVLSDFDLLAGGFYTSEETLLIVDAPVIDAVGRTLGPFYYREVPSTYEELALFGNANYRLGERLEFQFGVRKGEIRQSVDEVYSGPYVPLVLRVPEPFRPGHFKSTARPFTYLGVVRLKMLDRSTLYARFASGYRPGNFNLGLSAVSLASGVPTTFDPDQIYSYELGYKGSFFDDAVSVDASLYYNDWKRIQLGQINPVTNQQYLFNGGAARIRGFELALDLVPVKRLKVRGWLSVNDSELAQDFGPGSPQYGKKGDPLPITSKVTGYVSVTKDFEISQAWQASLSAQASFVGRRTGNFRGQAAGVPLPRQVYPAYSQFDARLAVMRGDFTANLYANNLTNKRGLLAGGLDGSPVNAFVYIQPRTIGLSVSKSF